MLKTRVISACIFVPVVLLCGFFGGWLFGGMVLAISLIGGFELGRLFKAKEMEFLPYVYYPTAVLTALASILWSGQTGVLLGIVFLAFAAVMLFFIFHKIDFHSAAANILGIVYIPLMLVPVMVLRINYGQGMWLFYLLLLIEWMTDTGAYFIGVNFGKHKLMPTVSPKKSVEGFFGGLGVAVICALVLNAFTGLMPFWLMLIGAVLVSVAGQAGDLCESALKRWAGVKDSGTLIPGHGGILDRFDSMLFAAPVLLLIYSIYISII